jgi:endonuclease YncB( thermonuclease family)
MRWPWIILLLLLGAGPAPADKPWREKTGCTLIENQANDGDSFHVKIGRRNYIFRLLFVDCPETDLSLPERVAEQAAYWGLSSNDIPRLGKQAAKFTRDMLKDSFTVWTQFDDAMGRSDKDRDYAIVKVGERDLAVELVRAGLARIYGKQEVPDEGPSEMTMRFRLKSAELEAKKNRAGAWTLAGPKASRFELLNPASAVAEQKVIIQRSTPVYSLTDTSRLIGYLTAGKEITALRLEAPGWVRVRFANAAGQLFEAQCRRSDLGL